MKNYSLGKEIGLRLIAGGLTGLFVLFWTDDRNAMVVTGVIVGMLIDLGCRCQQPPPVPYDDGDL